MRIIDIHFWEKYYIFITSMYSGAYIGFGLNGDNVQTSTPILVVLWCGILPFHYLIKKFNDREIQRSKKNE